MSIKLAEFLPKFRSKNGSAITHTTMPDENKKGGGAYSIPTDMNDDLNDTYVASVFGDGDSIIPVNDVHLNETADPNRRSPLKADFDFRFVIDALDEPKRRHTFEIILAVVKDYYDVLKEWIVLPFTEDQSLCFVFERPNAMYKDKSKNLVKDGIHLVWPFIVCPFSLQHKIREEMLVKLKQSGVFDCMQLTVPLEEVYDAGVIEGNWMMYGSCKPGHKPYELTHIIQYVVNEDEDEGDESDADSDINDINDDVIEIDIDREQYTPTYLVRILSMRNRVDSIVMLQAHKEREIAEMEQKARDVKNEKRLRMLAHHRSDTEKTDDDLQIICDLIDILNPRRADNYSEWIQLIWCCHNIHNTDERLLDKVIEFSKKSEKYKNVAEDACRKFWNESNNEGLGEGTLYMWAKIDNYKEYNNVLKRTVWGKVKKCATSEYFNPYEIAEITYDMYKNDYICVDTEKQVWYKFKEGRWRQLKNPVCLKKNVSTEVYDYFCQKPQDYMPNTNEIDPKKWRQLVKNANQLRQTGFKSNVIKESLQFFNDEEEIFMENLDEKRNLIGFNNGVMDLDDDNMLFREGRPDDYISMSTKINYRELSWDHLLVVEIMELIKKILPNKKVRTYVLTLISSMLHGSVKAEKYWFWTGSGGNGKGTLVTLINKAFGMYAGELPIQVLTSGRQKPGEASPEIGRLKGVRAVFSQEPEQGKAMNASLLKQFSGGDEVTARLLFGNPITFVPQWKLITCCNDLPKLPGDDGGVWRRVRVVHFGSRFVDVPDGSKNQFKKDESLKDKFDMFAEPFMWIVVQYYKNHYKKHGLVEPEEVKQATKDYQQEMDRFSEFIEANIMRVKEGMNHRILDKEAFNVYCDWMTENYSDVAKLALADFKKLMSKKFNMKYHDSMRVKVLNGKTLKKKSADGWWGYILKKDYVRLKCDDSDDENNEANEVNETIDDMSLKTDLVLDTKDKTINNTTSNTDAILNEFGVAGFDADLVKNKIIKIMKTTK